MLLLLGHWFNLIDTNVSPIIGHRGTLTIRARIFFLLTVFFVAAITASIWAVDYAGPLGGTRWPTRLNGSQAAVNE